MVKTKVYLGIAVIVALGVALMAYVYRGFDDVAGHLSKLEQVSAPFSIAAIEMEKNSGEYASGVLQYIAHPLSGIRAEADNDAADFSRYHDTYMRLGTDARKQTLGQHLAKDHRDLVATGNALMDRRDQLNATLAGVADMLERIDVIADEQMVPAAPQEGAARSRALAAIANVEAEAAEVGFWLATFARTPTASATQRVHEKLGELDDAVAGYRALPLAPEEQQLIAAVESLQAKIKTGIDELVAGEDAINELVKEFVRLQGHIDDVSDEEIEPLASKGLTEPQELADKTAVQVLTTLRYAIPLYFLIALTVGGWLVLTITRPLHRLATGTKVIGAGDLEYRIPERGKDEFDHLAQQFNLMVARLQETTVSKGRLETSERNLRSAVTELRREIAEHQVSEQKREKLQAELRRSEAMAAMGTLMAGVAHEVRNPLFGISSTLDAMDAGHSQWDAGDRYRQVLRREVGRLNKLMTDLLEYGKPPANEFSEEPLRKVIAEAVRVCTPAAEAAGVTIVNRGGDYPGVLHMNRDRLLQVFVNLIENAIQHAPDGSEVAVAAQAAPDRDGQPWVACSVADSGPGFAAEDLPRLFDPFFTRRSKGTGLGLAIVHRIVEEHQGTIEPGNRPEGGAIMTVGLPVAGMAA